MTHEDAARIHVGYGPVKYTWPCFAGDTFTKTFTVESIRNTSDGNHSVGATTVTDSSVYLFVATTDDSTGLNFSNYS